MRHDGRDGRRGAAGPPEGALTGAPPCSPVSSGARPALVGPLLSLLRGSGGSVTAAFAASSSRRRRRRRRRGGATRAAARAPPRRRRRRRGAPGASWRRRLCGRRPFAVAAALAVAAPRGECCCCCCFFRTGPRRARSAARTRRTSARTRAAAVAALARGRGGSRRWSRGRARAPASSPRQQPRHAWQSRPHTAQEQDAAAPPRTAQRRARADERERRVAPLLERRPPLSGDVVGAIVGADTAVAFAAKGGAVRAVRDRGRGHRRRRGERHRGRNDRPRRRAVAARHCVVFALDTLRRAHRRRATAADECGE